jgi:hypothetical protein
MDTVGFSSESEEGVFAGGCPVDADQVGDLAGGVSAEAVDYVSKRGKQIEAAQFAAGNQFVPGRCPKNAIIVTSKKPIVLHSGPEKVQVCWF